MNVVRFEENAGCGLFQHDVSEKESALTLTHVLLLLDTLMQITGEYGCMAFLDPFHVEQIDAEDKVGSILSKLREAPELLRQIDHQLGLEAEEEQGHH